MFETSALTDTMQSGLLTGMAARQLGFESQAMQQALHLYRDVRVSRRAWLASGST